MLIAAIEKPLAQIELKCLAVAEAVVSNDLQDLESASESLREVAAEFAAFMDSLGGGQRAGFELRNRLRKVALQLRTQRENLLRRSAVVERALQTLLPSTRKVTYGTHGRAGAFRGYGS